MELADGSVVEADAVVNCTGPCPDLDRTEMPLAVRLRERGLLTRDPLGLGAHCRPDGRVVDAAGVVREDPDRPDPGAAAMLGTPYGRILSPDAIAAAAVYLASDEAVGVHGISLDVDGGRNSVAIFSG